MEGIDFFNCKIFFGKFLSKIKPHKNLTYVSHVFERVLAHHCIPHNVYPKLRNPDIKT